MSETFLLLLFSFALFGPLIGAGASLIGGNKKYANSFSQSVFLVCGFAGLVGSIFALVRFLTINSAPIQFSLPLFFKSVFVLDGWSAFFLLLVNLGVVLSSLFAIGYLPRYTKIYSFRLLNVATALFIIGMQWTIISASIVAFLFFWEIMSIAAYFLVIADAEDASLKAGFLYFIMTHIGAACLLAGFLVLARGDVSASFFTIAQTAASLPLSTLGIGFFLIFIAFGSKAGLVPFHQWLPYAHPQAPSNSSAFMSGVMLKVAVYAFLRMVFVVFPNIPLAWAITVVVVGLLSAGFGILHATVESDLKRLLAWSSIENMGIIFTMIGTALTMQSLGLPSTLFWVAACFHALNHTIFKSGLFMGAGALISETHTRDLDKMGGLARVFPALSVFFLGFVFSAAALPPFGTFYGEWLYLQQLALSIGQGSSVMNGLGVVSIGMIALVAGLALFTFGKMFSTIFLGKSRAEHVTTEHEATKKRLPITLVIPISICAVLSLIVGFLAGPIIGLLQRLVLMSTTVVVPATVVVSVSARVQPVFVMLCFGFLLLIVLISRKLFANTTERITDTWDCGQPITARAEYTDTGFAAPIRFFFRSFLLSKKEMLTEQVTEHNPWILKRHLHWSTDSIWEEKLYRPIVAAVLFLAQRAKKLQNGVIQFYIFLVFVTLITVMFVAL